MLPILFSLGPVKIYTFGVFLVLAFFWAAFLLWKLVRLTAFKEEEIFDGLFWSLFGSLFFGRLVYIILNFKDFGLDLLKYLLINGYPGMSLWAMLMGGFLTFYLYSNSKKIKFEEAIDYFIPGIFLALGFGKIGSFFSGVEGMIKYNNLKEFNHWTPLYEGLLFFIAVFITYKIIFEIRKEKFRQGFNFYFFIWYFSLAYFLFDKLKVNHLYFLGYSFNKAVSGALLLTTSLYFLYYFRSLIFKRLKAIINFATIYGQKNIKKIHLKPKGKTPEGKAKDTTANK